MVTLDTLQWSGRGMSRPLNAAVNVAVSKTEREEQGMNVIIWLVVGGAMCWMAHRIMKTDGRQGAGRNVLVGIVGGLAGGWLLSPVVGADTADQHGLSLVVSFTGAMMLLVMVNLIRQIAAGSD